jgi:hypothetical protein
MACVKAAASLSHSKVRAGRPLLCGDGEDGLPVKDDVLKHGLVAATEFAVKTQDGILRVNGRSAIKVTARNKRHARTKMILRSGDKQKNETEAKGEYNRRKES